MPTWIAARVAGASSRARRAGEHTPKNVIIAATRRAEPRSAEQLDVTRRKLREQAALFGLRRQRLADWMGEELAI